ncbi:MAG: ATP-binding protein [Firmicutes bacterium]|nr:ATP-binding protein [Bacillota bacterium]
MSVLFVFAIIYMTTTFNNINNLHRYKIDYIGARTSHLLEFYQEFINIRHLVREMIAEPNEVEIYTELEELYYRLNNLAVQYTQSLNDDPRYVEFDLAEKLQLIQEILRYLDESYTQIGLFSETGQSAQIWASIVVAENSLLDLLQVSNATADIALEYINNALATSQFVVYGLIAVMLILLILLMSSSRIMLKTITQAKNVYWEKIQKSPPAQDEEISHMITEMSNMFADLVANINHIATENEQGNTSARLEVSKLYGIYQDAANAINTLLDIIVKEKDINKTRQLMFDSAPIVMTVLDEDLKILEYNEEAIIRYGFENKEDYISDFFAASPKYQPDGSLSVEKGAELIRKCYETGQGQFEWMHQTTTGEPIPSEVRCFTINYNEAKVILAYSIDLRELKKNMELLRKADERTQIMLDGMPIACYLIDQNFNAIDCNQETLKFFNFADKQHGLDKLQDIFRYGKESWEIQLQFDKAMESGYNRFKMNLQKENCDLLPCEITFVRLKLAEENVIATYIFDLSTLDEIIKEKQRGEAAEENSQMKSRFLARMSHEIRTPIAAVLGISEIQLRNTLPPELEEAFAKIYSSSSILLSIVNDILDLSKIEAGKMEINPEEYDTSAMLSDVIHLNLAFLGSKDIEFIVKADENIPKLLIGSELRIKQVLNNLLSNAFKYTSIGSVEFMVMIQNVSKTNVNLVITITDTGHGMTSEQLDALFAEYTQFHEKEVKVSFGTGLGMPITYSLIQMMGGNIWVESTVGKGTKFTVTIPQEIASTEILGKETAAQLGQFIVDSKSVAQRLHFTPKAMPHGKVLVVDDVDTNLYVAKGFLEMYELQIDTCESGILAIEKVKNGATYDIIFMDHMMPELDGIETTQILREMGYNAPIVALTANAIIGQAEEFLQKGFNGFISKPIRATPLDAILTKFINPNLPNESLEIPKPASNLEDDDILAGFDFSDFDDDDEEEFTASPEMMSKIYADFLESQQNAISELNQAIAAKDEKWAYRVAHNLKNMANLINDKQLVKIAETVEKETAQNEIKSINSLEIELNRALNWIKSQNE